MKARKSMTNETYQDEIFILKVKDWQTADKYVVCFSRDHGKVAFVAYGARYARHNGGRLLQPFAQLSVQLTSGKRLDTMRQCEILVMPQTLDLETLAYGAVIAEVVETLTEEHEAQEEIYLLLLQTMELLGKHNKRLVTLSAICKVLALCGFAPILDECTGCHKRQLQDAFFSTVQGGLVCDACSTGVEIPFAVGTQELMQKLMFLDFTQPEKFTVRGTELMQLEQIIYKFIVYQTDKPLKSLNFLVQMGI
ncbi:MAG: DNA repair protein RecO [Acidaminococcaceae bacterium]